MAAAALVGCSATDTTPCERYVAAANACQSAQGAATALDPDAYCAAYSDLAAGDPALELFDCTAAAYEAADCSTDAGVSDVEDAVAACSGESPVETDGDTGDTGDNDTCTNSFIPFPEDGEPQAFYRTTIEARLQISDSTATLAVVDGGGGAVAGTSEVTENHVTFTPSAPLQPGERYTATLTFACGATPWTFAVSEVGSPTSVDLVGRAYALDLGRGRFVRPEGIGDLLGQFLTTAVLLGVQGATENTLDTIGATGVADASPPTEDLCVETVVFPPADFTANPYFVVDADGSSLAFDVGGNDVTVDDLRMSGAFAPDASYLAGVRLAGSIDTYPLAGLVDPTCTPDSADYPACLEAVCELAAVIGGCVPCGGDENEVHCLDLDVDSIDAEGIAGPLVVRTRADIDADAACAPEGSQPIGSTPAWEACFGLPARSASHSVTSRVYTSFIALMRGADRPLPA